VRPTIERQEIDKCRQAEKWKPAFRSEPGEIVRVLVPVSLTQRNSLVQSHKRDIARLGQREESGESSETEERAPIGRTSKAVGLVSG
jgi:ACT domain-containing protein